MKCPFCSVSGSHKPPGGGGEMLSFRNHKKLFSMSKDLEAGLVCSYVVDCCFRGASSLKDPKKNKSPEIKEERSDQ